MFFFGQVVIIGPFEHHSNILPWRESGVKVERIPQTDDGVLDIQKLDQALKVSGS